MTEPPEPERCSKCGAALVLAVVSHPLHFRGSDAGLGKCRYENVAYCERCEPQPSFYGAIEFYELDMVEYARLEGAAFHADGRYPPHPFLHLEHCAECAISAPWRV